MLCACWQVDAWGVTNPSGAAARQQSSTLASTASNPDQLNDGDKVAVVDFAGVLVNATDRC